MNSVVSSNVVLPNLRIGEVDLILCEFDALNHVPQKIDLTRVARTVSRGLRPGGHFYFDVNNRLAFQVVWPGAWFTENQVSLWSCTAGYDRVRDRGVSEVEWFLREGKLWRRHHEHNIGAAGQLIHSERAALAVESA